MYSGSEQDQKKQKIDWAKSDVEYWQNLIDYFTKKKNEHGGYCFRKDCKIIELLEDNIKMAERNLEESKKQLIEAFE